MAKRDLPPRPGFRFPGPVPREALAFFDAKDLRVGFDHRDVAGREHAYAFTAAKAVQLDILDDLREAVRGHLAEGRTFESFRRQLTPILQKKGWWGAQEVIDPRTGDPVTAQLGSPRRLKTIYRANMRSARAAGQWERIQRTKRSHPYLLYSLGPSREHREEHVRWAGTLLPADDPWWADHFPPNGWGCNCRVRQVSQAEYERLRGRDGIRTERPRRNMVGWTNPRTGQTLQIDRGLDPSWAGNPGLDRARVLADQLAGKLVVAGAALAREGIRQVLASPLLEHQLTSPKSDLPVAWLDDDIARHLRTGPGAPVETRLALLARRNAEHIRDDHPDVTVANVRAALSAIPSGSNLVVAERGHWGHEGTDLVFCLRRSEDQWFKTIVRAKTSRRIEIATVYGTDGGNIKRLVERPGATVVRGQAPE